MPPREEHLDRAQLVQNLVAALLAVNNWPLEKTWAIVPELERQGLLDPEAVVRMEHQDVFKRLKRAGYVRSDYVLGLLVDRLRDMARVLSQGGLARIDEMLRASQGHELEQFLLTIKGVGPVVVRNFLILTESGDNRQRSLTR